jgi:hypothetical protein
VKRTYRFVRSAGKVTCVLATGQRVEIPVVQGILKHPRIESLRQLLKEPDAALKYTREAIRIAPWQVLREFPRHWLQTAMKGSGIRPGRIRALNFMLAARHDN